MRNAVAVLCLAALAALLAGCAAPGGGAAGAQTGPTIVRRPPPFAYSDRGQLTEFPASKSSNGDYDLRSYDLSSLDLQASLSELLMARFNSDTKWPESLPAPFDPARVMELGKTPGLNLRALHQRGITGKGAAIAIIDETLLVDHIEYRDRLKWYEEIHCLDDAAGMHGSGVASIAVGKTVGVAPEADLYYIAETHANPLPGGQWEMDFAWLAQSIDRVVEINKKLPRAGKIRVISISVGFSKDKKGYDQEVQPVRGRQPRQAHRVRAGFEVRAWHCGSASDIIDA